MLLHSMGNFILTCMLHSGETLLGHSVPLLTLGLTTTTTAPLHSPIRPQILKHKGKVLKGSRMGYTCHKGTCLLCA